MFHSDLRRDKAFKNSRQTGSETPIPREEILLNQLLSSSLNFDETLTQLTKEDFLILINMHDFFIRLPDEKHRKFIQSSARFEESFIAYIQKLHVLKDAFSIPTFVFMIKKYMSMVVTSEAFKACYLDGSETRRMPGSDADAKVQRVKTLMQVLDGILIEKNLPGLLVDAICEYLRPYPCFLDEKIYGYLSSKFHDNRTNIHSGHECQLLKQKLKELESKRNDQEERNLLSQINEKLSFQCWTPDTLNTSTNDLIIFLQEMMQELSAHYAACQKVRSFWRKYEPQNCYDLAYSDATVMDTIRRFAQAILSHRYVKNGVGYRCTEEVTMNLLEKLLLVPRKPSLSNLTPSVPSAPPLAVAVAVAAENTIKP